MNEKKNESKFMIFIDYLIIFWQMKYFFFTDFTRQSEHSVLQLDKSTLMFFAFKTAIAYQMWSVIPDFR